MGDCRKKQLVLGQERRREGKNSRKTLVRGIWLRVRKEVKSQEIKKREELG